MRIAIVTDTWPPEINGVALTVHGLAHGLADLGHAVQVVRPQPADTRLDSHELRLEQHFVPGVPLPRYRGLRFGLPVPRRLHRLWRSQRPDAVYLATEGPLGHSALNAAMALDIPTCSGLHTRFDHYACHYGLPQLQHWVLAGMRRFHNRAGATLVATRALEKELRGHGFACVQQLARAVDTTRFHPRHRDPALRHAWGVADTQPVLLHVGRLAPEKNLSLLLRVHQQLGESGCPARTVIVGDGPLRAAMQAAHPEIIFTGMLQGQALASAYASADLFAFPSLSETFGNVLLEAMASGLPVVAYNHAAAGEHLLGELGSTRIDCGDEMAFIQQCLRLARCADSRRQLGRLAQQQMQALSPQRVTAEFARLLTSLDRLEAA